MVRLAWISSVGAILAMCLACGGGESSVAEEDPASGARYAGYHSAQKLLEKSLVSPSSASYPWRSVVASAIDPIEGNEAWLVSGDVDADNAFGAKLRKRWEVIICKKGDELFPVYAGLDGKPVWGNALYRVGDQKGRDPKAEPTAEKETVPASPEALASAPVPEAEKPVFRTWKDASGEFNVSAEFISLSAGMVKLRKEDGSTIDVPIERLCDEDQKFIRRKFYD